MAVSELAEAILRIGEAFAGFRFLASKSYREKTKRRWTNLSKLQIFLECFGAIIGIAFVIVVLYALVSLGVSK